MFLRHLVPWPSVTLRAFPSFARRDIEYCFIISNRVACTLQDFVAADFATVATESIRANIEQVNTVRSHAQTFHVLFQELCDVDVIALHGVTQLICRSVVTHDHICYLYGLIIMLV